MKNMALISEFTFGFELEGFYKNEDNYDYDSDEIGDDYRNYCRRLFPQKGKRDFVSDGSLCNDYDTYEAEEHTQKCQNCSGTGFKKCNNCDDGVLPNGNICHHCRGGYIECGSCDGSGWRINYSGDDGSNSFEWRSPVLKPTPQTILKVIHFLEKSVDDYIYTNESCGFHIHIGLPDKFLRKSDRLWILSQLVLDEKMYTKIVNYKGINLYSNVYSSLSHLELLKTKLKSLQSVVSQYNKKTALKTLRNFSNDDKYVVIRQHPQGTLEWRGPRGFLGGRKENIKGFFLEVFYPFIKWIANAYSSDKLVIGDLVITKKEFNSIFNEDKKLSKKLHEFSRMLHRTSREDIETLTRFVTLTPLILETRMEGCKLLVEDGMCFIECGYFNKGTVGNIALREDVCVQYLRATRDGIIKFYNCTFQNCSIRGGEYINCIFENCEIEHETTYELKLKSVFVKNCNININDTQWRNSENYGRINGSIVNNKLVED